MQQGNAPDPQTCSWSIVKGPQDFSNVPSAGGQLTATVTNPYCAVLVFSNDPWVSLAGSYPPGTPAGTFIFNVAPNPSPGTARSTLLLFQSPYRGESVPVTQR